MARKKGERFKSDSRRWFRLESPQLADDTADFSDAEFRAFILIIAWANETKAQDRDDWVYIAKSRLPSVAPNRRGSVATSARVVRELCAKQSWLLQESDGKWSIQVRNYSQKQGFAPAEPRPTPDQPPATTTTTKTTTKTMCGADAPPAPVGNFVRMLTGPVPVGLNGETWDSRDHWFDDNCELIRAEAERLTGETRGAKFNGAFKSTMLRYWRNKSPNGAGRPRKETQDELFDRLDKESRREDEERRRH